MPERAEAGRINELQTVSTSSVSDLPLATHLPGLDLLRAGAVTWVMCFHSYLIGGLNEHFDWLSRFGWMGVDLFFVLSGFLIGSQVLYPLTHGQPFSFRDFYIRRAFRILPAFWVVLALYFLIPEFREAPGMEPWWKFATFIFNLSVDYTHNQAFSHAWSLCVEEHFYICFPLLAWLFARRLSMRGAVTTISTIVLVGIAVRGGIWLHDTHSGSDRPWYIEDLYYPTWNRLDGLVAGVALAALKASRPAIWAKLAAQGNRAMITGLLVVASAFGLFWDRGGLIGNTIGWPILSLGLALLVFAAAQRGSLLGGRAVPGAAWLASVSYSLYLVHKPIYHLVSAHFGEALSGHSVLAFASYSAASLIGAAILHYAVERPGLQLRRKWLSSKNARLVGQPG